jgi:signal transduction histidine kinase/CheY-like chemotaxis protein
MSPTTAKFDHIQREVLAVGFRAYPRALLNGCLFACLTVAYMWADFPRAFLVAWLTTFFALAAARLAIARAFLRFDPTAVHLARWTRYAALGYASTGLAWGILGAAAIHFAFDKHNYILWIGFLIALFAVLQTQTTGAHKSVFLSFLFCAMGPIIAVSVVEPAPYYGVRLLAELLLLVICTLVWRSGNRYMVDSIAMRYENLELLQDLTRQKEELDKANAAKTHFLAAASHDLRQPMQALVLLVESLQERLHEPDTRRIVKGMRSSVHTMAALLNAILDISKFDAGTVKPVRSHFRVGHVLDRLRSSFAQQAAENNLALTVMPSAAVVESDPILLYRILVNLTTNALRYTDRGKVLVGCRRRRDGLAIEVWDTGPGIPQEDLRDIFKEFHQLGNPTRDRDQGLGLGLAIVERTAALLDHPLVVKSRVGRGSMFSIRVPYGDAQKIRGGDAPHSAQWASLEGCVALVVEDDKEIRAAMTILLESWSCKVLCAASGPEARALVASSGCAPNVILADYRLPGEENGIHVIRSVQRAHPSAAGILISGDIAPAILKEAERSGFQLLHKPLRPARLRALLGRTWRDRPALAREPEEHEPA